MKKFIKALFMFVSLSAVFTQSASAVVMRDLFREAIKDGHSEGILDDDIGYMINRATGSTGKVSVKIKKVESYESPSCGRLHVDMSQADGANGKPSVTIPSFEISICADGRPPREITALNASRNIEKMKTCIGSIEKGKDDNGGVTHGLIVAKGCPAEGQSYWRYVGTCDGLKMGDKEAVIFPVNKDGVISFEIKIPTQCKDKKNIWEGTVADPHAGVIGGMHLEW